MSSNAVGSRRFERKVGVKAKVLVGLCAVSLATAFASSVAAAPTVITAALDGHPTHPVWYHDATAVQVGTQVHVAWNTNGAAVEARTWNRSSSAWVGGATQVSVASLDCHCTDSSGTDPNRHDVPSLFADPVGRVYAIYGGGTASKTGSPSVGPYFRAAAGLNSVSSWGSEQLLPVPGAGYDWDVARDNHGVNHLIGQQGDNAGGAGSLVYLRLLPGTATTPGSFAEPYRTLVKGGWDPTACAWLVAPGCDIFVIGRIATGPVNPNDPSLPSPLYLTWGWSEKNLSNSCGDPSGFCNRGLYFAISLDGGDTWLNATATASTGLSTGPIAYDDPAYRVIDPSTDVGLFKAIAGNGPYPGTPWIGYQPGADVGAGTLQVTHFTSTGWATELVDSSRAWNNHLVFRATTRNNEYLWSDIAQTGAKAPTVYQWKKSTANPTWTRTSLAVGLNWFLTGRSLPSAELLMWRAPIDSTATAVDFTLVPVS